MQETFHAIIIRSIVSIDSVFYMYNIFHHYNIFQYLRIICSIDNIVQRIQLFDHEEEKCLMVEIIEFYSV